MFSDQSLHLLDSQVEFITGRLLLKIELKINLKLESPVRIPSISIQHFVTTRSDGLFMVFFLLIQGLGQLRHHSNASGPQYGKRFKK